MFTLTSILQVNLDGFALPIKQLKGIEPVDSLNFSNERLGPASAVVIASLIHDNTAELTSINLLSNVLDIDSATMLLKVKVEKPNLRTLCGLTHEETEIDLSAKHLGPADAMLLAPEIVVVSSLMKIE